MTRKRIGRILLWVGAGLIVLVAAGAGVLWYVMNQPLYRPGMARQLIAAERTIESLGNASDTSRWRVGKDLDLFHFEQGTGQPILVVHGGPGYPFAQPLSPFEPLSDRYRFVYYDQRGCGRSSRPIDRFTEQNYFRNMTKLDSTLGLKAQIGDIERIRQILGEERLNLIGFSFGGFLAALYAAEFPEHVRSMILLAPADMLVMPQPDEGRAFFEQIRGQLPPSMVGDYDAWQARYLDFSTIFSRSEDELASINAGFSRFYQAATQKASPAPPDAGAPKNGGWMVQAMYFSMGRRHDYREALRAVKAPVLVVHGDQDLQPVEASRSYVDALPNARLKVIRGSGHFLFEDKPDELRTAVESFLGSGGEDQHPE